MPHGGARVEHRPPAALLRNMRAVLFLSGVLATNAAEVDFQRDIKPIFDRSCVSCHGPEKPKSGFRLDQRERAMRGGDNGKAILPGDSTNSPLALVVAGLHPEIEQMPPKGKGEPLTPEEITRLRAWIDQGAHWPETGITESQTTALAAPIVRWISVSGDERKFREHFGMKEGVHAGLQDFFIQEKTGPDSTLRLEGRLFPEDLDIRLALRYERGETSFFDVGFEQYQKYYDDSGGYYPFAQPSFALDRDLTLRIGRAWMDFGLTLPDAPKIALGYEYQYRQGEKSTLQWGPITVSPLPVLPRPPPDTLFARHIYPAFKEVDEGVHILKLDASHDFDGLFVEDNFRAEFRDLQTQRQNGFSMTDGALAPTSFELLDESHDEFRAVNALRFEKEIRDGWFVSGGYLHSAADADASFRQTTVHASGLPASGDFWRSHSIILSQNSVLLNGNTRLGPWKNFTLATGVQSEWMRQEGVGNVSLDTGLPPNFLTPVPAALDANHQKHSLQESASLRYTGVPFTSLFAEARLEQETIGTFEEQTGRGPIFARDTDAKSDRKDWRVGFYSSPLGTVSLGGHYRQRDKYTEYHDHEITNSSPGYPGFLRERRIHTHELEAKLTWRPLTWLKTAFTYQIVDTDFDSATERLTNGTPGDAIHAGTFNAHVYGLNLILTPASRWSFSGTFNYYDSRSASAHNGVGSVVPYRGDTYSVLANATYMLSTNTDLTASYTFSRADYGQDHFAAGLPLGIEYDWHVAQAGLARRFRHATANLQYAFYQYAEPSSGGFNDYTAHAVFAILTLHWP